MSSTSPPAWNVLHRLNWSPDVAKPQHVRFQDIGLDEE
jgi:hypothetical protein